MNEEPYKHYIKVECYSGYRGDESPIKFNLDGWSVEVKQILDRWIAPDHRYFKIEGDDERVYILRHDIRNDLWELYKRLQ